MHLEKYLDWTSIQDIVTSECSKAGIFRIDKDNGEFVFPDPSTAATPTKQGKTQQDQPGAIKDICLELGKNTCKTKKNNKLYNYPAQQVEGGGEWTIMDSQNPRRLNNTYFAVMLVWFLVLGHCFSRLLCTTNTQKKHDQKCDKPHQNNKHFIISVDCFSRSERIRVF